MIRSLLTALSILSTAAIAQPPAPTPADWKPVPGHIMTRWAKDVDPKAPWPEYPRPTMVREKWQNLNGLWNYAIATANDPPAWQGKILVPFPIESALSGVGKSLSAEQTLWYTRNFTVPADWRTDGQRVLLHFGAVDWHAKIAVNGKPVGQHKGGYDPFNFDITDALQEGENQMTVEVRDPTDAGGQPRGKQWAEPHGIWYTPTSGIWQTVWMEPVSATQIVSVRAIGHSSGDVEVRVSMAGRLENVSVLVELELEDKSLASFTVGPTKKSDQDEFVARFGVAAHLRTLWTPETPRLYRLRVVSKRGNQDTDQVRGHLAFRDVSLAKDASGIHRLMLNGKPTFMFGPLDQGFWPDGLYTPPTEAAMQFDIDAAKKMGCNMLRKHVKVESERFYYLCDKLGIMVWQDIPSPFFNNGKGKPGDDNLRQPPQSDEWKQNFLAETQHIVDANMSHPSIVMWVPWNEGWGQNDLAWSKSVVDMVQRWDPSRLVNCASGWTDTGNGHVIDIHAYPSPATAPLQKDRAVVLGEYGGLGLPLEGHTWAAKNNWGYVSFKTKDELTDRYIDLLKQIPPLIGEGLCAAVYTQTTDVEIETNGWLTYDREVWKIDPAKVAAATKALYEPPPVTKVIVTRAGQAGGAGDWRYVTDAPEQDKPTWMLPAYDDSKWTLGKGGFGTTITPGAIVGTEWKSADIYIRRSFTLSEVPARPVLSIHHDEDAEVYINGQLAATLKGYSSSYQMVALDDKAAGLLKAGKNTIAIHCHQTTGGQYIDCGLIELVPPK
ncbi:MAG: sugar-binding domain-containing protein [Planctomycetota bacterium]